MRAAALLFLVVSAAQGDIVIIVDFAWHEPDAEGGTIRYRVRTNLPDHAILELSLEARFDSLQGPLARVVARGRGEVTGYACHGTLARSPAPIPPGWYALLVTVPRRQRDDVAEAIEGLARPVVERDVFVGTPTAIVAACRRAVEQIRADLAQVASVTSELNGWIALSNEGKLGDKGAEYVWWHESVRGRIDGLLERAAIFCDKYPSPLPASYAALNDLVLNLGDHESSLWRVSQGVTQGNDPEGLKVQGAALIERKLGELRFLFAWECAFALADLPAQLAALAAPDLGLPRRIDWNPWRSDLEAAIAAFEDLAGWVAPEALDGKVRAAGVEGRMGPDDAERRLNENRAKAVAAVPPSIRVSVAGLKALLLAVDAVVEEEPRALTEGLMRQREALLAQTEKVRGDLRTFRK